jgi:hypothetical protein
MSNLIKFAISDTSVTDLDKLTLGLILARYKDVCNQTNDLNLIADVFLSIEKSHREKIFRENIDIYSIVASFNDTLKSKNLNEKADQLMNKDDYPFR